MKNWIIVLSGLISLPSLAADICVAERVHKVSYGSTMHYAVTCNDQQSFKSKQIITTFLLPIPYKWNQAALKRLTKTMTERGLQEVAALRPSSKSKDDLLRVFERVPSGKSFCTVMKSNPRKAGLNAEELVYDVAIRCDQNRAEVERVGVTDAELTKYFANLAYRLAIALKGEESGQIYEVYQAR